MLVPIETLIDGVVRTLTDVVAPDVTTRTARGQLYAAIDVLRNLRDRVEPKAALAGEEAASAEAALAGAARALRRAGAVREATRLDGAAAAAPSGPPAERAAALRAAIAVALETIDGVEGALGESARAAIAAHLAAQAMRDVAVRKPSLLAEISRG